LICFLIAFSSDEGLAFTQSGHSRYVGRVAALGIGTAIATPAGFASVSPTESAVDVIEKVIEENEAIIAADEAQSAIAAETNF
jgi:hypothetical protein